MKKIIISLVLTMACCLISTAQETAVQFGKTAQQEATVEKILPLLNSPALADVEALCKQVASDGLNDALVRTKLFMLGPQIILSLKKSCLISSSN